MIDPPRNRDDALVCRILEWVEYRARDWIGLDRTSRILTSHTDVASLNGSLGGLETQTDILVPAASILYSRVSV